MYGGDSIGGGSELWIQAYEVDASARSIAPIWMMKKADQDFARYATPFEQECSKLVKDPDLGSPVTVPAVVGKGDDLLVVGYVATVSGAKLYVPQGVSVNYVQLGKELEKGVPIFIANDPTTTRRPGEKGKGPLLWKRAGISEFEYTVLTRVDGGVVLVLASRATGFVESEFGPILFLAAGLAPLGQSLVRGIINSLFRREGGAIVGDLVLDGMTDELAESVAAEEATILPRSAAYVRQSGIAPTHFRAFQDAARETEVIVVVRNGKEAAIPLIEKGCPGKPKFFEPFNTNERTGILTATTEADKQLVFNNNYILVNEDRIAMRRLANGAMEDAGLKNPFWQLEPGQVIDPVLMKPVVGDYDLMGVFSETNAGQNIALHSVNGVQLQNMSSPIVEEVSQTVNQKLDLPRVLHGAQDQFAGFRGGATAFFPDGTVQYFDTAAEVDAFYASVGRQPITGAYPQPWPDVPVHDELGARRR